MTTGRRRPLESLMQAELTMTTSTILSAPCAGNGTGSASQVRTN